MSDVPLTQQSASFLPGEVWRSQGQGLQFARYPISQFPSFSIWFLFVVVLFFLFPFHFSILPMWRELRIWIILYKSIGFCQSFMCLDVPQFVNVVGRLGGRLFCLVWFIVGIGMSIWCGPKGCCFEDKKTKENRILFIWVVQGTAEIWDASNNTFKCSRVDVCACCVD